MIALAVALSRPAAAAGTFTPSGTSVQIAFMTTDSSATVWTFTFSGAMPVNGTCPAGGTFALGLNGTSDPYSATCAFPAATTSGSVSIGLSAAYACTSQIQDGVGSVAGVTPDSPLTCTSEQTTTTALAGTTTTSTTTTSSTTSTTTTQPTTTTTGVTTTTLGPCQCSALTVFVSKRGVSVAHVASAGAHAAQTRVTLLVSWTLDCTTGVGKCSSRLVAHGPAGGSTALYPSRPTSAGSGSKSAHRLRPLSITCAGPCGATTHGHFYLQWTTSTSVANRSIDFAFDVTCAGQTATQTMTLVFSSRGVFLPNRGSLGDGRIG